MTGPEIIKKIIKIHNDYIINFNIQSGSIKINDEIYNEIFDNFKLFGNTPIFDIDQDHIWVNKNNDIGIVLPLSEKDETILSYKEYIYAVRYYCSKTNAIGYTFQYKSYVIKPFFVVQHVWEPIVINDFHRYENKCFYFKCKLCSVEGKRASQNKFITQTNYQFLTCNENIIKNIIE